MKKCPECLEIFEWNEEVVIIEDEAYHNRCVELYPVEHYAMVGDEVLGTVENEVGYGDMAFQVLRDGQYKDYDEED